MQHSRVLSDLVRITQASVPWAIPVVLGSVAVAVVVGALLQRRWGATAWLVAAAIVSVGLIVGITLTPNAGYDGTPFVDPRPDPGPWGYLTAPAYWFHLDARSLNVALFIPLGLTLALLARGSMRWVILAIGLAAPWLVEGLQRVLPFARDTQYIDVADNSTGFVVGFLLGFATGLLIASARRSSPTASA